MRSKILTAGLALVALTVIPGSTQARDMQDYPAVKIRALDKVTARNEIIEIPIGSSIQFESLFIKASACRKAPPIEQPESAGFLEIWEFPINKKDRDNREKPMTVYSGWMFASSPGLASMDHPIYDIIVLDCAGEIPEDIALDEKEDSAPVETETKAEVETESAPAKPFNFKDSIRTEVLSAPEEH